MPGQEGVPTVRIPIQRDLTPLSRWCAFSVSIPGRARSRPILQKNWCCAASPSLHSTNFFARKKELDPLLLIFNMVNLCMYHVISTPVLQQLMDFTGEPVPELAQVKDQIFKLVLAGALVP